MKISSTFTVTQAGMGLSGLRKEMIGIARTAAKVGVLRSTAARDNSHLATGSTGKDMNNAEVGFANEFGSVTEYHQVSATTGKSLSGSGVPERSFLRVPLTNHMDSKEEVVGRGVMSVLEGNIKPDDAAGILGLAGVEVVDEAFATGGYGLWPPNSDRTAAWKGHARPLIDTGQLADSIASETVKA